MKKPLACWAVLAAVSALSLGVAVHTPVLAQANGGGEQGEVRKDRRAGTVRPLRDIEREILPRMSGMQYLGPEYDSVAMAYRMKFIQNGKVSFVDVDARTGRIIGQSR